MTDNKKESKFLEYKFQGTGLTTAERNWAKKKFRAYRTHYHIESYSDLQLLEELVFREALQERTKARINRINKSNNVRESNLVPKHIWTELNNNEERILVLKEKLGLFKEKNIDDPFKKFEVLQKKFEIWKNDHIEERKVTCPFCSKIFFLNIRIDKYQESKLKLYKNKVLCNEHLWKCYKEGKITKEDLASILNVSIDYIFWLEKHIINLP